MPARSLFPFRLAALVVVLSVPAGCNGDPGGPREGAAPPAAVERVPDAPAWSDPAWPPDAAAGAVVYVPVYSHVYHQDETREVDLAATLSVRNTDPERPVTVAAVAYYDSDGRLVRDHLGGPLVLGPLGTRSFVVAERDRTGGVGANFLVTWWSGPGVSEPVVEAVMISTANSQGLSFVGAGRVVRRHGATGEAAGDG